MTRSTASDANGSTGSPANPSVTSGNFNMPSKPKKDRLITRDVALVMLATFFFMTSNMIITPIIAGYGESMGAAGTMMGIIAGVMSFVSLFCRPIAGNLSDLVSKRLLVAVGTSLYIIAGIMYCLANSTGMLIAARVVNGLGFACGSVCLATWVSLLLPIRHMGAGMGLYGIVNALAIAVGPALGIRLQAVVGYHLTFVSSLVLNVFTLVVVMLVNNGGNPARKTVMPSRNNAGWRNIARHLRFSNLVEPRAIPLTMVFMMFAIPYFANQSFIVDYIAARHLAVFRPVLRVLCGRPTDYAHHHEGSVRFQRIQVLADDLLDRNARHADIPGVHDERLVPVRRRSGDGGQLRSDEFGHSGAGCGDCRPRAQRTGQQHVLHGSRPRYGIGPDSGGHLLWTHADQLVLSGVHVDDAARVDHLSGVRTHHPFHRSHGCLMAT